MVNERESGDRHDCGAAYRPGDDTLFADVVHDESATGGAGASSAAKLDAVAEDVVTRPSPSGSKSRPRELVFVGEWQGSSSRRYGAMSKITETDRLLSMVVPSPSWP